MSKAPQLITASSATSEPSIYSVMAKIGLELARWERGAQSDAETYSHIGVLVSAGKQLMLATRGQT